MSTFNFDAESRHQHYLERFKTGEVNSLDDFLVQLENRLVLNLSRTKSITKRSKINAMLKKIHSESLDFLKLYTAQLGDDLLAFSAAESRFIVATLAKDIERDEFIIPNLNQLRVAANARPFTSKLLREELADFPRKQARLIRNMVSQGFAEGKSNAEIISDILGTEELKFKDGTMNLTRNDAGRLVRTSTQHIAAVTRQESYRVNDVTHYAWISTLDSRTSPTCQKRDGQVYEVGKGPIPPAHPNCRSTTIAVDNLAAETKMVDNTLRLDLRHGLRPEKDEDGVGKTNIKNDYNSWLSRQSKGFQIDALGKTKTELFRKGGLTVSKFVDRLDLPLTLEELELTFPTAWEKANLATITRG